MNTFYPITNQRYNWKFLTTFISMVSTLLCFNLPAEGATLSLGTAPLFDSVTAPPLNMLVLGRDHKLFMAAYNDASDLDGDGILDIGYKGYLPSGSGGIDYFGYFSSKVCYSYDGTKFVPSLLANSDKSCDGATWSGDFLNYVTMSRIDALRKVLYGGYRSTDTTSQTVLERAYIPQDAHSFGKEYQSIARDGYDINKYTPLPAPTNDKQHYILFANTTPTSNIGSITNPSGAPLLRVMSNTTHRIWEWVSKEAPVAGSSCSGVGGNFNNGDCDVTPTNYIVRVQVCVANFDQDSCEGYPNSAPVYYKPYGLLQQYGETDQMYFGLLSGSYVHNFQGGVVRKEVSSFKDEIDSNTGIFVNPKKGMIATLDGLKIEDYDGGNGGTYLHNRNCSNYWGQTQSDGNCRIWGNPIGEMMFESLRYFAGASSGSFTYTSSGSDDAALGLPEVTSWKNPYGSTASGGQGYPICANPVDTVISDVNTSRDSELPGNPWTSVSYSMPSKISSFDASAAGQTIWNNEFGSGSQNIFIGEVGSTADGMPTVKSASSFGNIRGLSPEEPTRQGTYYAASVAYFGHINDINTASGDQKLSTYAVALSSPIPRMQIPVNGKIVTLVPLGKVVNWSGATPAVKPSNSWQPTEQIVAFYVDSMYNMPGQTQDLTQNGGLPQIKFRINFEDAEQGNDYDMDEIVSYTLSVTSSGKLNVQLKTEYASAGAQSHIGYVISGTDKDGVYLEVQGGDAGNYYPYKYDTPSGKWAGDCMTSTSTCAPSLPNENATTATSRTFTPGNNAPALLLNDPLWYAAKYGGFSDDNVNKLPDEGEWDANTSGTPDNYFLVTNALTLGTQMANAFNEIIQHTSSASAAAVNSGSISTKSRVYQAIFHSGDWLGHLLSFKVNTDGSLNTTAEWDAADKLPAAGSRNIYTMNSNGTATTFTWAGLDSTRQGQLSSNSITAALRLNYLRGDGSSEINNGGVFRNRAKKLGDIIDSTPMYVGAPTGLYGDSIESSSPYSTFFNNNVNRQGMVYVGANDGMLHAFDGTTGIERFAYIPTPVFGNLRQLTRTSYTHKYYVDGSPNVDDAFVGGSWKTILTGGLNGGGKGIYALDVTDPTSFSTSKVMWEFTDGAGGMNGDADLGYTFSQPIVVKLNNGKWAAIFGNGYNNTVDTGDGVKSSTGHAVLYIVDASNGSLIKKIDTMTGTTSTPNGLATPAVVDADGDGIADYVYAGDLQGNLWKFDISNASSANWGIPYVSGTTPIPLYVAKDASGNTQPITSRPAVSYGPSNIGLMVYFGTGKWLEDPTDRLDNSTVTTAANQRVQTFYGIYDPNSGTSSDAFTGRSNLGQQSILAEVSVPSADGMSSTGVRITSTHSAGSRGWYMDLVLNKDELTTPPSANYQGERMVSNVLFRDGRIIFNTLIPQSDPCTFGGSSWIMELNALNGSRLSVSPFDVNNDGNINSSDYVTVTVNGVTMTVPASGFKTDVGITNGMGIMANPANGTEDKYFTGSNGDYSSNGEKKTEITKPAVSASWQQLK